MKVGKRNDTVWVKQARWFLELDEGERYRVHSPHDGEMEVQYIELSPDMRASGDLYPLVVLHGVKVRKDGTAGLRRTDWAIDPAGVPNWAVPALMDYRARLKALNAAVLAFEE